MFYRNYLQERKGICGPTIEGWKLFKIIKNKMVRRKEERRGWRLRWVDKKAVKRGVVGENCAVNTYFAD